MNRCVHDSERVCPSCREVEHILQFFAFDHLPARLQEVSRPFGELAAVVALLPPNRERTKALDKLLEAKDAAVRALHAKVPS